MIVVVECRSGVGYGAAARAGTPAPQPDPARPGSAVVSASGHRLGDTRQWKSGPIQNDYSGGLTSGIIG